MKVYLDCVREVLLAVENLKMNESLNINRLSEKIPSFSTEDIEYTCLKLEEAGYINATFVSMAGAYLPGLKGVYDITYNGHEFLNAIREPTRWEQVKTSAAKIGSFSLETAAEIARNLITAAIPSVLQSVLK